MTFRSSSLAKTGLAVLVLCLEIGLVRVPLEAAQAGRGGPGQQAVDPRVEQRTYLFADTNEELPYAVFVSSKVSSDKKNPLVIALHGLGGSPVSLLRGNALDLAEEGGYILVGPMGYNSGGWYGSPVLGGGRGRGGAAAAPPNLSELSEKDVMNVLDMIRGEYNVDENRTYLMGHSMGGAGTFHLGVKYASNWAAIAAIAPAAFALEPDMLSEIPEMPVIIVQGDADTLVPVENTRRWADKLEELEMMHEYHEIAGGDHGNVISIGMPDILAFFDRHSR
jgi:predicted esterase